MAEQRITRNGRKQVVAGLSQQCEQQRIRFARSRGDEDALRRNGERRFAARVVLRDRVARAQAAFWVRLVAARAPILVGGLAQNVGWKNETVMRRVAAAQV